MRDDIWSWLESLKAFGTNKSLEPTGTILSRLDNPQNSFPAVHIAGSNGKGTCCAILANALTLYGTRTGLFTSPHLMSVNERIRIDGESIDDPLFEKCLKQIRAVCMLHPQMNPTYYEVTFLVAMLAFQEQGVERAVIETGLGGRWDATRHVDADCCVLTKIALEHTEVLGESLEKIAQEKAAIVRYNRPFIALSSESEDVNQAITETVDGRATICWVDGYNLRIMDTGKVLAKSALEAMNMPDIAETLDRAVSKTIWPGRYQIIPLESEEIYDGNLHLLLDGAHNSDGMEKVLQDLSNSQYDDSNYLPEVILFGCTQQSNLQDFMAPLVQFIRNENVKKLIITEPVDGRRPSVRAGEIFDAVSASNRNSTWFKEFRIGGGVEVIPNLRQAFDKAKNIAFNTNEERYPVLFCTGSLYLIGNIMEIMGVDAGVILRD
jgi:dihydrofolate synthase/folylpolyglutamate synthase